MGKKLEQAEIKKVLAQSKQAKKEHKIADKKGGSKKKDAIAAANAKELTDAEKKALRTKLRAIVTREETGPRPTTEEPPFTFEVHGRRQTITVDVQLHKIPHQHIKIDETTDRKLVVDTTAHTKKYRLEWEFPSKMTVHSKKAEYTFERGILSCVFQVKNMPDDVQQDTEKMIESIRAGRKMRFRYDAEGDLSIRTRRTTMTLDSDRKRSRATEEEESSSEKKDAAPETNGKGKNKVQTPKAKAEEAPKKSKAEAKSAAPASSTSTEKQQSGKKAAASTTPAATTSNSNKKEKGLPTQSDKPNKQYVSDDITAKIAERIGTEAKASLKKKQKETKQTAAAKDNREDAREDKRSKKKEQLQTSFASLIEERKRRLAERTALAAAPPKKANPSNKSVSFAK